METNGLKYVEKIQNGRTGQKLSDKFEGTSREIIRILENMLKFNPEKRFSAKECLKSPVFDSIRRPNLEREAPWKIYLGCDKLDAFDYSTLEDLSMTSE